MAQYRLALLCMAACVCGAFSMPLVGEPGLKGICKDQQKVKDMTVDLNVEQYLGLWYEQGRSNSFYFDRNCYCTTANYTANGDGTVKVANGCNKGSVTGKRTVAYGKAEQDDSAHPGYLTVTFGGVSLAKGVYEVMDTDYTSYSIVASCTRVPLVGGSLVWILTRQEHISDAEFSKLVNKAKSMGFDVDDLVRTQHDGCDNASINDTEEFVPLTTWKSCATGNDVLQVSNAALVPSTIKRKQPFDFVIDGTLSKAMTGATAQIQVTWDGHQVFSKKADIPDASAGRYELKSPKQSIPAIAPGGNYGLQVSVTDGNGQQVTCVQLDFQL